MKPALTVLENRSLVTGIPILPEESPKQLIKEIGTLIDVNVDDVHITAAHRLPDTKNVKHWLIVKLYIDLKLKKCTKNAGI